jgi:hypothetical protein
MGTRADYYLGRGERAEWLGSSAWDGHPVSLKEIAGAETEKAFLDAVNERLSEDDGTRPKDGWPWPWETSSTTDFAYAWDEGKVWISCFGREWQTWEQEKARTEEAVPRSSGEGHASEV